MEYVFVQAVFATHLHTVRKVIDLLVALESGEVLKIVHLGVPNETRLLGRLCLDQSIKIQDRLNDIDMIAELIEKLHFRFLLRT